MVEDEPTLERDAAGTADGERAPTGGDGPVSAPGDAAPADAAVPSKMVEDGPNLQRDAAGTADGERAPTGGDGPVSAPGTAAPAAATVPTEIVEDEPKRERDAAGTADGERAPTGGDGPVSAPGTAAPAAAAVPTEPAEVPAALRLGTIVSGTVVAVSQTEALVDVGGKADGLLPAGEWSDPQGGDMHAGQTVTVAVTGFDRESGAPRLSQRRAADGEAWDRIEQAHRDRTAVEGPVREQVKGGLVLDIGLRAFMPASQVERGYVADLVPYVGQTLRAHVLELDRTRGKVILSRRALLEGEARQRREQVWAELEEGQIRDGVVKGLTDFGAFIDLGGVDGLLHVSAMSWQRVDRPADMVSIGDPLRVRILKLDRLKQKISLGLKQVEPDPWIDAAERYPVGAVVEGQVTRLCSFGAFVQLQAGLDGLIHISQMSAERVAEPGDVVHEGQAVAVTVLRVAPAERRISLSLRPPSAAPAAQRPSRAGAGTPARRGDPVTVGEVVGNLGRLLQQGLAEQAGKGPGEPPPEA